MTEAPAGPGGSSTEGKAYSGIGYAAIGLTLVSLAINPLILLSVAGIVLAWLALRRIRVARAAGNRVRMRGWLIATLVVAILCTLSTGWNDLHLLGLA